MQTKFLWRKLNKQLLVYTITAFVGGMLGWLYWKFIGCKTGSCSITSKPFNSAAYGAIMAMLVTNLFISKTVNNK